VDEMFRILMTREKVRPRREFIQKHALPACGEGERRKKPSPT
jgi:hypothetical protein